MKRIRTSMLVIVIVLLLPAAFAGAAVADHVYEIRMDQQWDYEYPPDPIEYVFTAEVFCDATIEGISFSSPNGSVFNLLKYEFDEENDRWEWIYEGEHATADELSLYGDGNYIFTINYAGGGSDETSVPFSTPSGGPIPQPTQEPVPTYPLHGMTGVPTEVTFGWDLCEDDNANYISIGYFPVVGPGLLGETLFECSHTSYGPVSLTPGKLYELELFFAHACSGTTTDGIPYTPSKSLQQVTTNLPPSPKRRLKLLLTLTPIPLTLKAKLNGLSAISGSLRGTMWPTLILRASFLTAKSRRNDAVFIKPSK